MNEIRIYGLLQDRYDERFLGLVHKITRLALRTPCCPSNKLASHPVGRDMRQSLGESIKNAINKALLTDKEQHGALIVGGRRRNRKKRNKNKSARKKKNARKEERNDRNVLGNWNNQEENYDESPLIKNEVKSNTRSELELDEGQGTDPDLDQGQEPVKTSEQDKENIHPEKMPLKDFFKTTRKKKEKKEKKKKEKEKENKTGDSASEKVTDTNQSELTNQNEPNVRPGTLAALAQTVPKKPQPAADSESELDQDVADGGETFSSKTQTKEEDIKNLTECQEDNEKDVKATNLDETEMKPVVVNEPAKKSEHSPLIKESKLSDTGPGFLCCTIL